MTGRFVLDLPLPAWVCLTVFSATRSWEVRVCSFPPRYIPFLVPRSPHFSNVVDVVILDTVPSMQCGISCAKTCRRRRYFETLSPRNVITP